MDYSSRIHELRKFDKPILDEVVREGEMMLAAQLAMATAADQRALTFSGFLIATGTAALGGTAAMILSTSPSWGLVLLGGGYAVGLIAAAGLAIWSAKPGLFSIVGNEPASWHPAQWRIGPAGPFSPKQARIEQAENLQSQLSSNAEDLKRNGRYMTLAVSLAFAATVIAALLLGFWAISRYKNSDLAASESAHQRAVAKAKNYKPPALNLRTGGYVHRAAPPRPVCKSAGHGAAAKPLKRGFCG